MTNTPERPGRAGRLLKNFSWLAGGKTSGALLTLAATALAARTLGAETFGFVVMIHAAALLTKNVVNVRTSDAVIRFGVPLAQEGRTGELKGFLLSLVRIDLIAGLVAATAGSALLLVGPFWFALPEELIVPAVAYVAALAFGVVGTAKGLLRLHDEFGALSVQLTVGPALKLVLVGGLVLTPLAVDARFYVVIWAAAFAVEQALTWRRAWQVYRREYGADAAVAPDGDRSGVRRFLMTTYWQSTLDTVPKHVATLLAGTWLGTAGAAVFSLSRELAEVLSKPVSLIRQVVFPDLARLWRDDLARFVRVTWKTGAVTAGFGLLVVALSVFWGRDLMVALAGDDFAAGAYLLTLLLAAASVDLGGAVLRPAGYVMGKAGTLLGVQVIATLSYLVGFVLLTRALGLPGIGYAAGLAAAVSFLGAALVFLLGWRERRAADNLALGTGAGSVR